MQYLTESEVPPEALEAFQKIAADHLAASPLNRMSEWIKAGKAPLAAALRNAGYISTGSKETTWVQRKGFIARWGFSIPCAEAIDLLYRLGPVVELGAGSGYWTAMVRAAGGDMIATDLISEGSPGYGLTIGLNCDIVPLDGVAAVRAYPDRNLFCSWPTMGDDWCSEAVAAIQPGRYFAMIGAERGGTSGTDTLFDVLAREFEHQASFEIPQFPGSHDVLALYRRKF